MFNNVSILYFSCANIWNSKKNLLLKRKRYLVILLKFVFNRKLSVLKRKMCFKFFVQFKKKNILRFFVFHLQLYHCKNYSCQIFYLNFSLIFIVLFCNNLLQIIFFLSFLIFWWILCKKNMKIDFKIGQNNSYKYGAEIC